MAATLTAYPSLSRMVPSMPECGLVDPFLRAAPRTGPRTHACPPSAKFIDPATFFDEHPVSDRPFIMSPYAACVNTLCAYPSPDAVSRALLLAHHDAEHPHHSGEAHSGGYVPTEELEESSGKRVLKNPWRFVGVRLVVTRRKWC